MTKTNRNALVCLTALSLLLAASPSLGDEVHELPREQELRLAMSAGPPAVSAEADLYVLGQGGFEKAYGGTNGWSCLVVRVAGDERALAPHCLNPEATSTVLPAMKIEAELQREGLSADSIRQKMKALWDSGELELPSGPAFAYMLSSGQRIGPRASQFQPHFMLYIPYISNSQVGGSRQNPQYGFVGPVEDHPLSTVVILMDEFVDPEDMVIPGS